MRTGSIARFAAAAFLLVSPVTTGGPRRGHENAGATGSGSIGRPLMPGFAGLAP
jgi:hypothetical protein